MKRKRILAGLFLIAMCFSFTGCGIQEGTGVVIEEVPDDTLTQTEVVVQMNAPEKTTERQESVIVEEETAEVTGDKAESEQSETDESVVEEEASDKEAVKQEEWYADYTGGYCYEQLSTEEKKLYEELLYSLGVLSEKEKLSTTDTDMLAKVFQAVLNDHPEIFYVEGYTYTKYSTGDEIQSISFRGNYIYEKEEIKTRKQQIEAYAETVLAGMPAVTDEYEVVRYLYEYLISHTDYVMEARDNQNICSVCIYGESVCQGYAKTLQYLLGKAGIEATLVIGKVSGGEGHAWNLVRMNDNWYYVDVTWGDASYQMEEGTEEYNISNMPSMNYDYLGVTTEQLLKTHILEHVVPLPECMSLTDNYYVREGAYFECVDEQKLTQVFEKAKADGKDYVTLKCADSVSYAAMKQYLLDEQKIFFYLESADGVLAYSNSEEQFTLSFWMPM